MSKKLIAGAGAVAAFAVALAPLATFAEDLRTQTDTLEVTIADACSFGYDFSTESGITDIAAPSHSNGAGTWSGDKLSISMEPGTSKDSFGTTKLNIFCNDVKGYNVKMSSTTGFALNGLVSPNSIAAGTYSDTTSGWTVQAAANGTVVGSVQGDYGTAKAAVATTIISSAAPTANTGDTFDITYGVGVAKNQAADVYTGNITYTLAVNQAS